MDGMVRHQAIPAVLGHEADTQANRYRGIGNGCLSAFDGNRSVMLSGPGAIESEGRLDAAGSHQAEQSEDLTASQREAHVGDALTIAPVDIIDAQIFDGEDGVAIGGCD